MELVKAVARAARPGPEAYFTGTVMMETIVAAVEPARVHSLRVSFHPGARTAWHTHPLGQTLFVLSGSGLYQTWGQPAVRIDAGDSVWISPGEKHWHGASPDTAMTHIAFQESLDGAQADWLDLVSDSEFAAAAAEA